VTGGIIEPMKTEQKIKYLELAATTMQVGLIGLLFVLWLYSIECDNRNWDIISRGNVRIIDSTVLDEPAKSQ